MSTNARGVRSLEQHVELIQAARNAMITRIPPRNEIGPGVLFGELNNHRWQIDIRPLGEDWVVPDAGVIWIPQLVKIHVRSPGGGALDLETIRLVHRPRQ